MNVIELMQDPVVTAILGAVVGALFKPAFDFLKSKAAKTATHIDDDLIAAAEEAAQKAIDKYLKKNKVEATAVVTAVKVE